MRQSIQQDEKAIESLVKQASSLETMIAWLLQYTRAIEILDGYDD